MIIYKVTNIINNKIYIGQTIHSLNIRKVNMKEVMNMDIKLLFKCHKKVWKRKFYMEIIYETDCIDDLNRMESFI